MYFYYKFFSKTKYQYKTKWNKKRKNENNPHRGFWPMVAMVWLRQWGQAAVVCDKICDTLKINASNSWYFLMLKGKTVNSDTVNPIVQSFYLF